LHYDHGLASSAQLVRLLLIIVMIGHYLACAFYAVAGPELWFRLEDCPGSKSCYKAPAFERCVPFASKIVHKVNDSIDGGLQ
jgi:hypothetical protein